MGSRRIVAQPQKYRKRPVVIEAVQYDPSTKEGLADALRFVTVLTGTNFMKNRHELKVKTLEGWLTISPGDWIIKGVAGEFYPCKPDIFAATYEKVEG